MDQRIIRSCVISTDPGFRETLEKLLGPERGITLDLQLKVPFEQIGEEELSQLQRVSPELVFLDLEDDPALGIKLAQFLADADPPPRFVAVGPTLSPELLLAGMRAGVCDCLPKPATSEAIAGSIGRAMRVLGWSSRRRERKSGQLYTFFSAKGGSGSTTVATNLAIHLHRLTKRKTLLVDLDLEFGEIAVLLRAQPRYSLVDVAENFQRLDAALLTSFVERHPSGIHLLAAPRHPEKAEVVTGEQIRMILQFLQRHYDFVLVDTSKSFSPATLAAFEQANRIFLVTTLDLVSLRNLKRCLPLLRRMAGDGQDRFRLVVNRYRRDDLISLDDVRRTVGLDVYKTLSNEYAAVSQSINTGKPILLNGRSRYARDVKALGADIAGLVVGPQGAPGTRLIAPNAGRRSLWSRIFHGAQPGSSDG